jgi:hypothetical protein
VRRGRRVGKHHGKSAAQFSPGWSRSNTHPAFTRPTALADGPFRFAVASGLRTSGLTAYARGSRSGAWVRGRLGRPSEAVDAARVQVPGTGGRSTAALTRGGRERARHPRTQVLACAADFGCRISRKLARTEQGGPPRLNAAAKAPWERPRPAGLCHFSVPARCRRSKGPQAGACLSAMQYAIRPCPESRTARSRVRVLEACGSGLPSNAEPDASESSNVGRYAPPQGPTDLGKDPNCAMFRSGLRQAVPGLENLGWIRSSLRNYRARGAPWAR